MDLALNLLNLYAIKPNQTCKRNMGYKQPLGLVYTTHVNVLVWFIGLGVRVFANGPGDLGSIPDRVIPKTQKMVLDASLLSTQHYKVRIKGKVEQSRKGVAPSPTHWCSSYRKGSLRVTLDYGRQLYFICLMTFQLLTKCACKCFVVIITIFSMLQNIF